jgi:hypothetical protein
MKLHEVLCIMRHPSLLWRKEVAVRQGSWGARFDTLFQSGPKLRCKLWGCIDNNYGACDRCGSEVYGGFIHIGESLLWPITDRWERLRKCIANTIDPPRCPECERRMKRREWSYGCCERPECRSTYVPF